jgi:hypothetical protein
MSVARAAAGLCVLFAGLGLPAGCAANRPMNPSIPISVDDARLLWAAMEDDPRPFERPVIVLGGIYDPGFIAQQIVDRLRSITTEPGDIMPVAFPGFSSFDACARKVVARAQDAFPSGDPSGTREVDVVGFSMGGLVARHAAAQRGSEARLHIRRLFTIATPHRGARLAWLPSFDSRLAAMRPGSPFLARLDEELLSSPFPILPYVRLGDIVVGAANASPPPDPPWWVPGKGLELAHIGAGGDVRILLDIARRLRGESPISSEPRAPLPSTRDR